MMLTSLSAKTDLLTHNSLSPHGITKMWFHPTNHFFFCFSISFPFSPVFSPLILPHTVSFRCNVQDYIWHKGARCESVVTEFQVMCLAVGASALVVLLLFMIIVCFAKKLHVLKTENKKLRKRR